MDEQDYKAINEESKPQLKQTAVDWLYKLSKERELDKFDLKQIKQMEKEQMINAYVTGRLKDKNIKYGIEYYNKLEDFIDEAEEYYNETYEQ